MSIKEKKNGLNCTGCAKPLTGRKQKYCSKRCGDDDWAFEHRLPRLAADPDKPIDTIGLLKQSWAEQRSNL